MPVPASITTRVPDGRPHLDARGIAPVALGLGAGHRQRPAHAPETNLHGSRVGKGAPKSSRRRRTGVRETRNHLARISRRPRHREGRPGPPRRARQGERPSDGARDLFRECERAGPAPPALGGKARADPAWIENRGYRSPWCFAAAGFAAGLRGCRTPSFETRESLRSGGRRPRRAEPRVNRGATGEIVGRVSMGKRVDPDDYKKRAEPSRTWYRRSNRGTTAGREAVLGVVRRFWSSPSPPARPASVRSATSARRRRTAIRAGRGPAICRSRWLLHHQGL